MLFILTAVGMAGTAAIVTVSGEFAAATPFGRTGVIALAVVTIILAAFGLVALRRGAAGSYRRPLGYLLVLAMVSAAVLAFCFFVSGVVTSGAGYLPAQAAVLLGLTGRAVLAAKPERQER
ncbi:hypothetical protein Q0Z83_002440 [Actinoplanes sichuanensis]|nr:hypothetical protein [Actinoplanes sichuanensis]BEL02053.1 hypothetical protein Q0Z83_002440 [Actinoplanes sichuanensis]